MSHFVVMVTNTDEYGLESQLEPFYEQGDESDYFMKREYFLKNDEKEIDSWLDSEIESCQKNADNKGIDEQARKYWKNNVKELKRIKELKTTRGKLKAIKNYYGGGLDRDGLYWMYNPEAKWDWWVIGGRWNNWLVTKNGDKCNSCKIKDLDFEKMRQSDMEDRARYYDSEIKRAKETGGEPFFWGYNEVPTREEYINDTPKYVSPFAVLHDEEWIEKGSMGWFGMSDDNYTDEEWGKKFQEFIESLDPETEVTIVDCHI